MLLQRYSPDSGLRSELGRIVENPFLTPWTFDPWAAVGENRAIPAAVEERENAVVVKVELPGVDPDKIDVDLVGDQLTIALEADDGSQAGAGKLHRFRSFRQSLRLPCAVDPDAVTATSKHGVLTVELMKPAESRPKRIAVKTG